MLQRAPTDELVNEFIRVWPLLEPALDLTGGTHNQQDVLDALLTGVCQLWTTDKCAIVTHSISYPRTRVLEFWLAGGDLEDIESLEPDIIQFAKQTGHSALVITGRVGWVRRLKRLGYTMRHASITKRLD